MAKKIFVNLPVADLNKSVTFFTKLGFKFKPQFTDEKGTCMVIGEDIFVMLLVAAFFKTFTKKEVADAMKTTEAILALSADSRKEVDEIINRAVKAGGISKGKAQEQGNMYGRGFQDLDGHLWEVIYLEEEEEVGSKMYEV